MLMIEVMPLPAKDIMTAVIAVGLTKFSFRGKNLERFSDLQMVVGPSKTAHPQLFNAYFPCILTWCRALRVRAPDLLALNLKAKWGIVPLEKRNPSRILGQLKRRSTELGVKTRFSITFNGEQGHEHFLKYKFAGFNPLVRAYLVWFLTQIHWLSKKSGIFLLL